MAYVLSNASYNSNTDVLTLVAGSNQWGSGLLANPMTNNWYSSFTLSNSKPIPFSHGAGDSNLAYALNWNTSNLTLTLNGSNLASASNTLQAGSNFIEVKGRLGSLTVYNNGSNVLHSSNADWIWTVGGYTSFAASNPTNSNITIEVSGYQDTAIQTVQDHVEFTGDVLLGGMVYASNLQAPAYTTGTAFSNFMTAASNYTTSNQFHTFQAAASNYTTSNQFFTYQAQGSNVYQTVTQAAAFSNSVSTLASSGGTTALWTSNALPNYHTTAAFTTYSNAISPTITAVSNTATYASNALPSYHTTAAFNAYSNASPWTLGSALSTACNVVTGQTRCYGASPQLLVHGTFGATGTAAAIEFKTWATESNAGARIGAVDDGTFSSHLTLSTKTTGTDLNPLLERMRITSAGRVGVGTTTPSTLLDVNGTVTATGFSGPVPYANLTGAPSNSGWVNGTTACNVTVAGTVTASGFSGPIAYSNLIGTPCNITASNVTVAGTVTAAGFSGPVAWASITDAPPLIVTTSGDSDTGGFNLGNTILQGMLGGAVGSVTSYALSVAGTSMFDTLGNIAPGLMGKLNSWIPTWLGGGNMAYIKLGTSSVILDGSNHLIFAGQSQSNLGCTLGQNFLAASNGPLLLKTTSTSNVTTALTAASSNVTVSGVLAAPQFNLNGSNVITLFGPSNQLLTTSTLAAWSSNQLPNYTTTAVHAAYSNAMTPLVLAASNANHSGFQVSTDSITSTQCNLCVGTTGASAKLTVVGYETTQNGGAAAISLNNTASMNTWVIRAGGTGTFTPAGGFSIGDGSAYRMMINANGYVAIGQNFNNPAYQLDVAGTINATSYNNLPATANYTAFSNYITPLVTAGASPSGWTVGASKTSTSSNVGIGTTYPSIQVGRHGPDAVLRH